jgi:pyrroloquinoline quinone (PQQ) biosynthesis protein C
MQAEELGRFFSVPMNRERAQILAKQMALFIKNRRMCWANALAATPELSVKRVIALHEHEELVNDPRCGSDHFELQIKQAAALGLSANDIQASQPTPGTRSAMYAWSYMTREWPWLESYACCVAVEKMNDNRIIEGGGMSYRQGKRLVADMGMSWKELASDDLHRTADEDHADLTWGVLQEYAPDAKSQEAVLRAGQEALEVYRSFFYAVALECERVPLQ